MKTGIYNDIPNSEYHGGEGISKSGLDLIARSPLHYWNRYLSPNKTSNVPTPAMTFGSAIHSVILEPEKFHDEFIDEPSGINKRTNEGKKEYADFVLQNADKIILSQKEWGNVFSMKDAVKEHPVCDILFSGGKAEQSVYWDDEDILCKCRPDYITVEDGETVLVDLKTTEDASYKEFQRSCVSWRYDVQAAWYLDGYEKATGIRPERFMFVAVEKKPPYAVAIYHASEDMINRGREKYQESLDTYRECLKTNVWEGYPLEVQELFMPPWA